MVASVDGARAGWRRQEVGTTSPITKAANLPPQGLIIPYPRTALNRGAAIHVEEQLETQMARACMGAYASPVPGKSGNIFVAFHWETYVFSMLSPWASTASEKAQEAPTIAPRGPRDRPETAQDVPKKAPRRPKGAPKRAQEAPKTARENPKTASGEFPEEEHEWTFRAFVPRRPPGGLKKPPERPQEAPRSFKWPRGRPRRPQRGSQGASKLPPFRPTRVLRRDSKKHP